jgi:hypothetical protein
VSQAKCAGAGERDLDGLGHAKPRLSVCLVISDGRKADDRESRADKRRRPYGFPVRPLVCRE